MNNKPPYKAVGGPEWRYSALYIVRHEHVEPSELRLVNSVHEALAFFQGRPTPWKFLHALERTSNAAMLLLSKKALLASALEEHEEEIDLLLPFDLRVLFYNMNGGEDADAVLQYIQTRRKDALLFVDVVEDEDVALT